MNITLPSTMKPGILQCKLRTKACGEVSERRSANYKPNMWSYDFVQSLSSEFINVVHRTRIVKLKEEFMYSLMELPESSRLHSIDSLSKLGLSSMFYNHIKDALDSISSNLNMIDGFKDDILITALCFRLLRQHGHNVSEDVFSDFFDETDLFEKRVGSDLRGVLELFEASHLAIDGEEILVKAKDFLYQNLKRCYQYVDDNLSQNVIHVLRCPCHWRVSWFNARRQIHAYEQENDRNEILLELAKVNFNVTQAFLIEELKEMSRWWKNLGLVEENTFCRDRLVESFLWATGIAVEPEHALLRKCLSKVVNFVLVLDDLYDIYGSLEELQSFTRAVERWDFQELHQLPDSMKIFYETLRKTTAEMADEIQEVKGWDDVLFYLNTTWADFCKAMLVEAQWCKTNHIPSLEDYLRSSCISSSGPVLSLVTLLCTGDGSDGRLDSLYHKREETKELVYYISLIIRLCNDLGTSAAELERGDLASSIVCYMVEMNATEEMAREHISLMIVDAWKKINTVFLSASPVQQTLMNRIINIGRVCQFMYQEGDGFGDPKEDIRKHIKGVLIEPI